MSETIDKDQLLRIKAMELCIELYNSTSEYADVEEFEGMANNIYEFIKGETK
jgi:hypothetical protein